jgi:hypothetical protein
MGLIWQNIAGPFYCIACLRPREPNQLKIEGWVLSRTGGMYHAYVTKIGAPRQVNLLSDGLLVGLYPNHKRAQQAVEDWLRIQGVKMSQVIG